MVGQASATTKVQWDPAVIQISMSTFSFFLNAKPATSSSCMTCLAARCRRQSVVWELHLNCKGNPSEEGIGLYYVQEKLVDSADDLYNAKHFSL